MPNQHKTRLLGWHPTSAEKAARVRAEAERRDVDLKVVLDEMLDIYVAHLDGGNRSRVATTLPAPVAAPEQPARQAGKCEHRIPAGAYCRACGKIKEG